MSSFRNLKFKIQSIQQQTFANIQICVKQNKKLIKFLGICSFLQLYSCYFFTDVYTYGENKELLNQILPVKKYYNTFYLPINYIQMVIGLVVPQNQKVELQKEIVKLKDDGQLSLHWQYVENSKNIILIFPGVSSSTQDYYVQQLILKCKKEGFSSVVVHSRGIECELSTAQYHSALTYHDFLEAIDYIQQKHKNSDLYGIGISLGANYLINIAAEKECKLKACVSIANPFNIGEVVKVVSDNILVNTVITRNLKENYTRNFENIQKHKNSQNFDINKIKNAQNPKEFELNAVMPMFEYESLQKYHQEASCQFKLEKVNTPCLFINSLDDPISHHKLIPLEQLQQNKNFITIITQKGGHVDWFTGYNQERWAFNIALKYVDQYQNQNLPLPLTIQ